MRNLLAPSLAEHWWFPLSGSYTYWPALPLLLGYFLSRCQKSNIKVSFILNQVWESADQRHNFRRWVDAPCIIIILNRDLPAPRSIASCFLKNFVLFFSVRGSWRQGLHFEEEIIQAGAEWFGTMSISSRNFLMWGTTLCPLHSNFHRFWGKEESHWRHRIQMMVLFLMSQRLIAEPANAFSL